MPGKKQVAEMIGEFLRDAAVLVLVFALLDRVISPTGVSVGWAIGVALVSGLLLFLGILVERGRKE